MKKVDGVKNGNKQKDVQLRSAKQNSAEVAEKLRKHTPTSR